MDKTREQILKITGERIRRARIIKGLTQTELATKCGYSDGTTIYKIEKGKRDIPTSKVRQLCKALDVDFNYLKGDIDYIVNLDGAEMIIERQQADDRLSYATESQLKQVNRILTVLISGDDSGDADL